VVEHLDDPSAPRIDVVRIDLLTGKRAPWKTLTPPDPVGVDPMRADAVITPDARSYCYSYSRRLGDLFIVKGLE
jgi:eukaryotic-like serine/threonine-protein kinase